MDSQRTGADSDRIHDLERRLDMMEDRQSAVERSRQMMSSMVPSETRRHMRAAWRENLLAVRSLLDRWIDTLGDEPAASTDGSSRESIPID